MRVSIRRRFLTKKRLLIRAQRPTALRRAPKPGLAGPRVETRSTRRDRVWQDRTSKPGLARLQCAVLRALRPGRPRASLSWTVGITKRVAGITEKRQRR